MSYDYPQTTVPPMSKARISGVTLLAILVWQHAAIAEPVAPLPSQLKQVEDIVPDASQKDEQAAKEALRYLLHSHAIPLTVNASCKTVGMDFSDKTIGDFTSGMLSQFVYAKGSNAKNWISASCRNNPKSSKAEPIRDCEVTFHQARLEEETLWAWGFKFSAKKRHGAIIQSTLQCLTAG